MNERTDGAKLVARVAWVLVGRLVLSLVIANLAVLIGCAIAFAGRASGDLWQAIGPFAYPAPARTAVLSAILVVNLLVTVVFSIDRVRLLFRLRRLNMSIGQYVVLPVQQRRNLISGRTQPNR